MWELNVIKIYVNLIDRIEEISSNPFKEKLSHFHTNVIMLQPTSLMNTNNNKEMLFRWCKHYKRTNIIGVGTDT
jgi:hypothetical protein